MLDDYRQNCLPEHLLLQISLLVWMVHIYILIFLVLYWKNIMFNFFIKVGDAGMLGNEHFVGVLILIHLNLDQWLDCHQLVLLL